MMEGNVYVGPLVVFDADELQRIRFLTTNAAAPQPVDKGILRKIAAHDNCTPAMKLPSP